MGSGCETSIAGRSPSSARQLPILAALYAKVPTLNALIIHHRRGNYNTIFPILPFEREFLGNIAVFCRKSRAGLGKVSRVFEGPGRYNGIILHRGGNAMQCQKLKTYMETGRVVFLPARAIRPNPHQPRQNFSQEALEELSLSIREHGILQPLSVRRAGTQYELIAGERRLRAGIRAGLTEIPCIVMQMDDRESAMAALIENLQRKDLDYIEQAQGFSALMSGFCLSQEQAARLMGLSQSSVANKLRLLRHSFPVLELLRRHGLTERHARALLKLPGEQQKAEAIRVIAERQMNVAQAERYIEDLLERPGEKEQPVKISALLSHLELTLTKIQKQGICAVSERRETEKEIVLTVTIPKT